MPTETPTKRLATLVLGRPVAEFIAERRPGRSWRLIARDLYESTQGEVDVTPELLRRWFVEDEGRAAS